MASRAKALVIPIFRRYWLWHGFADNAAEAASQQAARSWRQGATLEERFQLLGQQIISRAQARLLTEWRKLESAREGTLRNWGYRLAQGVLSREDPQETFLKQVPRDGTSPRLDIIYPDAFKERFVRRRLRLLAHQGHRRHRRRLLYWALAMVPQLPLMVTPLPNITVYYTAYRIFSHYSALQGSKTLEKGFVALDSLQLAALRDDLLRLQAATGVQYAADTWPAKLIRKERRYLDIFDRLRQLQGQRRLEAQLRRDGGGAVPAAGAVLDAREGRLGGSSMQEVGSGVGAGASGGPGGEQRRQPPLGGQPGGSGSESEGGGDNESAGLRLLLVPSPELSRLMQPGERGRAPLGDEAALAVGKAFQAPHVLEHVARARRRVVGAMFPAHWE